MLGEPLDLCQPGDDTYDWGPCYDWNFAVLRSSINALAVSSGTESAARAAADAAEAASRLAQDLTIGASTASLQSQLTAEEISVAASTGAVSVSTAANGVAISTTGAAVADLYNVKLSTGVQVPTGLLNYSTITAAIALKANAFVGISSTCASGFHLSTTTVVNGIITGGGCLPDGGSGGLASIPISSGIVTGGVITNYPQQAVQNIVFSTAGLTYDVNGSTAIIGVKNLTFVASTQTYIPTGTSIPTPWAFNGCQSTAPITMGNNSLAVMGSGTINSNGGNQAACLWVLLDGQHVPGHTAAVAGAVVCDLTSTTNDPKGAGFAFIIPNMSAGTHNVCVGGGSSSSGSTYYTPYQLSLAELATGGQGYSAPASSRTVDLNGKSVTQPSIAPFVIAVDTVQVTTRGGPVNVCFSGSLTTSGASQRPGWSFIVDHLFVDGMSPTKGVASTYMASSSESASPGQCYYLPAGTIAAGTHDFGFIPTCGAASACTIKSNTVDAVAHFLVKEENNAAGTGDVSSGGPYNLSGVGQISGPLTVTNPQNFEVMIASQDVFSVYNATIDATWATLAASTTYHLKFNLLNNSGNSAGFILVVSTSGVTKDCDYAAHYGVVHCGQNSGWGCSGAMTSAYNGIPMFYDGAQTVLLNSAGGYTKTSGDGITFETIQGSSTTWNFVSDVGTQFASNGVYYPWQTFARYAQGVPINGICIVGSSSSPLAATTTRNQKFSAHIELWRGGTHP